MFFPANDKQRFNLVQARSSGATKQSHHHHQRHGKYYQRVVLGVSFFQYSLQIVNLGNDVIQNVIIIYKYILDYLRVSLTQELYKTVNFNQGRPRQNYRTQTPGPIKSPLHRPLIETNSRNRVPCRSMDLQHN